MNERATILAVALFAFGCSEAPSDAEARDAGAEAGASDSGKVAKDAKSSSDTGTAPESSAAEAGPSGIPMFIAQGLMGRSTISCDDGKTWVADRAFDTDGDPLVCGNTTPVRCGETSCTYWRDGACQTHEICDCLHHTGFGKGVSYGGGWFVGTWGWGHPGAVRRTRDGVTWEETLSEKVGGVWAGFGGLAYGKGRFILADRAPYFSEDGSTWAAGQEADFRGKNGEIVWSVRDFNFIPHPGASRFIASASPPEDVLITDDGDVWRRPAVKPDACVQASSGVAYGNGVAVAVGSDGRLCTSTDGGDQWTEHAAGVGSTSIWSREVIWTGSEFLVWGEGADYDTRVYRSSDGVTWQSTVTDPPKIRPGPIARSEKTGTFVTTGNIWSQYEGLQFYRSQDGVKWEPLPAGAFNPGHGIFEITFGYGEASDVCPAG